MIDPVRADDSAARLSALQSTRELALELDLAAPRAAVKGKQNGCAVQAGRARLRDILARQRHARAGLERREWGVMQVTVTDPFGSRILFTEPIEKAAS